jgi:4-hydroxy-2-oxoheptanedioate aldolase
MHLELEKAKKFKAQLRAGESCFGVQIGLNDPAIAEIFGRAGFDWIVVDTEHSSNNPMTVQAMLQAAAHTGAIVIGRPQRLDPDEVRRLLDVGSQGILCPFINGADEARRLVQACRYPPAGIRGYGPRRAGVYGFDEEEYFTNANQALSCLVIIESRDAIENIDEIVGVDGIDGVVIGPMDLSISLNVYKQLEHPSYVDAVKKVRDACAKARKAMGTGCYSIEHAQKCRELGDTLLLVGGDEVFLRRESLRWMDALRKGDTGK